MIIFADTDREYVSPPTLPSHQISNPPDPHCVTALPMRVCNVPQSWSLPPQNLGQASSSHTSSVSLPWPQPQWWRIAPHQSHCCSSTVAKPCRSQPARWWSQDDDDDAHVDRAHDVWEQLSPVPNDQILRWPSSLEKAACLLRTTFVEREVPLL